MDLNRVVRIAIVEVDPIRASGGIGVEFQDGLTTGSGTLLRAPISGNLTLVGAIVVIGGTVITSLIILGVYG
jgi:hypothetical protein